MKKITLYILIVALFSPVLCLQAQNAANGGVVFEQLNVNKEGQNVSMDMNLNLDNLKLGSQEMIVLTPVLESVDKMNSKKFDPIVLTGKKRWKALNRSLKFHDFEFDQKPQAILRHHNQKAQSIPLALNVPYESWMRNANLVFSENVTGCANCDVSNAVYEVKNRILPPMSVPEYVFSYIVPPVEPVKQRSETYVAHLNFKVGSYQLLRDFQNNASVLNEADMIVSEIRNDSNLTVTEFKVVGYASPEGNFQSNMVLSENRALAFVNYMKEKHGLNPAFIKTEWKGEDWVGLRKAVAESNLAERDQILNVIDFEPNIAQRKIKLQRLGGGAVYRMLLKDYYPPLRRNEYTIAYVARPFDVEEAKVVIKTKPQYLSLNEMFLVANTYPKDSKEFKEVFDIAVRMYPDNPVAQLNTAALELENGAVDAAITRLQTINVPEAWNNLGIAYVRKGEYEKAIEYFNKASVAGVEVAKTNGDQLSLWLSEQ